MLTTWERESLSLVDTILDICEPRESQLQNDIYNFMIEKEVDLSYQIGDRLVMEHRLEKSSRLCRSEAESYRWPAG